MAEWTAEQLENAAVIAKVGREVGASGRDIAIALMAAIVESGLRNLDYGDRDSVGMFQQRDAWGSTAERVDPYSSARMFFLGGAAGQRGLMDIKDRSTMGMGEAAQAVQVSAFPDRYAQHQSEATGLLTQVANVQLPKESLLGDVPGLMGMSEPVGEVVTETPEVNGVGEVTADSSGVGALTFEDSASALGEVTFDGAAASAMSGGVGDGFGGGGGQQSGSGSTSSNAAPPSGGGFPVPPASYMGAAPTPAPEGSTFRGSFKGHDPYELTEFEGKTVDFLTYAALEAASKEFGHSFTAMQGSHNRGGVAASGGTHDGGGVVDIAPTNGDWEGAVKALRKMGFAAWVRNVPGYGYAGDGAHIHAVLMGHEKLSPQAQVQVQSYLNNDDGLVGSRPDDSTREFVNNRFEWGDALAMDREQVVKKTAGFVGTPFQWGGEGYTGIDDIGLARKAYGNLVPSARTLADLVDLAEPLELVDAEAGDLLTWDDGKRLAISVGEGLAITAGGPGRAVQVVDLADVGSPLFAVPMASVPKQDYRKPRPFAPPPVTYSHPDETPRGLGSPPSPVPSTSTPVTPNKVESQPLPLGGKRPPDAGV